MPKPKKDKKKTKREQNSMSASGNQIPTVVRIAVLGDLGSGKTRLLERFVNDTFVDISTQSSVNGHRSRTIRYVKAIHLPSDKSSVNLEIYEKHDTEKLAALKSPTSSASLESNEFSYRYDAVIMCVDISESSSIEYAKNWNNTTGKNLGDKIVKMLVVTKGDLIGKKDKSTIDDLRNFSKANGCLFFVTSAKKNKNINRMFKSVAASVKKNLKSQTKALEHSSLNESSTSSISYAVKTTRTRIPVHDVDTTPTRTTSHAVKKTTSTRPSTVVTMSAPPLKAAALPFFASTQGLWNSAPEEKKNNVVDEKPRYDERKHHKHDDNDNHNDNYDQKPPSNYECKSSFGKDKTNQKAKDEGEYPSHAKSSSSSSLSSSSD
jgi:GTPase SAR1 family protein